MTPPPLWNFSKNWSVLVALPIPQEEIESAVLMVREGRDLLQHLQLSPWPENVPAVSICVGARSLLVQTDCAEGDIKFLVELEEREDSITLLHFFFKPFSCQNPRRRGVHQHGGLLSWAPRAKGDRQMPCWLEGCQVGWRSRVKDKFKIPTQHNVWYFKSGFLQFWPETLWLQQTTCWQSQAKSRWREWKRTWSWWHVWGGEWSRSPGKKESCWILKVKSLTKENKRTARKVRISLEVKMTDI